MTVTVKRLTQLKSSHSEHEKIGIVPWGQDHFEYLISMGQPRERFFPVQEHRHPTTYSCGEKKIRLHFKMTASLTQAST